MLNKTLPEPTLDAPAPELDVYRLRKGSHEYVIAVPNRMAALKAWGAKDNLFALGVARTLLNDPGAIAFALNNPGVLLRRRAGSRARFKAVRQV